MDPQRQVEMLVSPEPRGNRATEDLTEEQFLKDLYLFMKKRGTPIERIPHLGFKQIDLYLMYKTVKDLGGYHQTTAQQLWKQVYNTLGGNPRSTSAATCTRRHYEKLMLPYECHVKGLRLNSLLQPRTYEHMGFRKLEEDGPPAKRRPDMFPLQTAPGVMSDHHPDLFPLSPYHKFYFSPYTYPALGHTLMSPSHLPAPPPPPPPYLACTRPRPSSAEHPPPTPTSRDPLEHLRCLAKQYESSAGLSEPLNLSVRAPVSDTMANPVSSFSPPSSNKNPKFLNKPSPLYKPQNANEVKSETAGETSIAAFPNSSKDSATGAGDGRLNPKVMPDNGGRMEIEIPLSVFNDWLQIYGPQAMLLGSKQQLFVQEDTRTRKSMDLTFEIKQSKTENGNVQQGGPGSVPHVQYSPACGILKSALSRDVYLLSDGSKRATPTVCWDLKNSPTLPTTTSPPSVPQDLSASRSHEAEESKDLQLTPEEVLKLRKIISNSA